MAQPRRRWAEPGRPCWRCWGQIIQAGIRARSARSQEQDALGQGVVEVSGCARTSRNYRPAMARNDGTMEKLPLRALHSSLPETNTLQMWIQRTPSTVATGLQLETRYPRSSSSVLPSSQHSTITEYVQRVQTIGLTITLQVVGAHTERKAAW